ncbi:DUF2088 domain-containing protein [Candidatus Sumerlaeota bacterium]|nr:DUF2088 domain-containing protein [Candidatus Sumerlaeota bacterium]
MHRKQDYFSEGGADRAINLDEARTQLARMLDEMGRPQRVLILPPDFTRFHSWAGELTVSLCELLAQWNAEIRIMPALGTHLPMTPHEIERMFPGIPADRFFVHDWRNALIRLGETPGPFVHEATEGALDYPIFCEINRAIVEGGWDRIISVGQAVPHEVVGIANHAKNIFVGAGGQDTINKTHFAGAVYGMERMMGRSETCVRKIFRYMSEHFTAQLPITYVLTVRAKNEAGELVTRGLYAGDSDDCFSRAAKLCQQVNLDLLDEPLRKIVVWLDAEEFKSTWLGNKAIYRTRMAMAGKGELLILAPGVDRFGEDKEIDRLIRKYGYKGTPNTLRLVKEAPELGANLSAAAHLIHGSSEGRFTIRYCPGHLNREEIEGAGFEYGDLAEFQRRYDPSQLRDGINVMPDGEEIFFVSNPALGLWGLKSQFES